MTFAQSHAGWRALVVSASAVAALLASGAAAAVTITYSGSGIVSGPAQTPPILTGLTLSPATSNFTFDGDTTWRATKLFFFNTSPSVLAGGGSFTFSNASSSFSGTFVSSRANATAPTALTYTVTGGTGVYAGHVGTGFGFGTTIGNPFGLPAAVVSFSEGGFFNISPVPEPGSALLLSLGLAGAALWRRRQSCGEALKR